MKRWLGLAAILFVLMTVVPVVAATDLSIGQYEKLVSTYSIDNSIPSYEDYREAHGAIRPEKRIEIDGAQVVRYEEADVEAPIVLHDYDGMSGDVLLTGEEALTEWEFSVEETGWYDIRVEYYPYPGKDSEIQRAFFFDGKLPYNELSLVSFARIWRNDLHEQVIREKDENGKAEGAKAQGQDRAQARDRKEKARTALR